MHSTLHSNKLANILIVNDDQENTAVLRTLLTRSDYSVYFASRIEDALNTIEHRQVHLLILNIQLKTANAIELCKQVKTNTKSQHLPIIFFGNRPSIESKEKAFEAGGVDFICTPFVEVEILTNIKTHLSLSHANAAIQAFESLEKQLKERSAKLASSEERLELVLKGTQQGYWDWNIKTGEIKRNQRWAKMLGYQSIEEFESSTDGWTNNIHPNDRAAALTAINDHLAGRTPIYETEYRMLTKHGGFKWVMDRAKIVSRDANGQPLRMCGTHTDITERKQRETENFEKFNLLEMFYKHTHDCIVLLDKDFNFIRVNEAYARACSRDASEFPGHNHFEFYPSNLITSFQEVVRSKKPYIVTERPFNFPDHPDWGTTYWDLSLIPILDETGNIELLLFTLKDVTERKRASQEKEALQKQLQQAQKMESIGQLTGGIAHDFNNLLGVIIGYTEMSIKQFATPPKNKLSRYLNEILHAGERGRDLVSKMLAFGRSTPGEQQAVDAESLISEVTTLLEATLPSSLAIHLNIENNVPPILADAGQIHQVITNLIINAHHAIGEHGKIVISLFHSRKLSGLCSSCHQTFSGEFIEISVCDSGIGIQEHLLEHIFEPFFTTKKIGKGSGMGLPMVHGILHQYNGHILVEPGKEHGTNFRLFFQTAENEVSFPAKIEYTDPVVDKSKRILIIDDDEGMSNFMTDLLKGSGYVVHTFNNPVKALSFFKKDPNSVDLVITDQTMQHLTGAELSRKLLSLRPNLPIILCTGYSETIDEESAKYLGIRGFLHKPVSTAQILNSIRAVTEQKFADDLTH